MQRPARRWHIHLDIEGDSWELAGKAFTKAMHILMTGRAPELEKDGKPFTSMMDLEGSGFALEITVDPKMTPDVYAELKSAWQRFRESFSDASDKVDEGQ
jgi:hypothetical protein